MCCDSWGLKESDTTERLNWADDCYMGFPSGSAIKSPPATAGDMDSIPDRGGPLEKEMATTPVFLPGKSHGQRSLVGYSPKGSQKSWA